MALQKQGIDISFAKGLDLKSDPFRVPVGNFLSLQNTVFTKAGLLQKRNGFGSLASLPTSSYTYATTFNGNLTAIGSNLAAYSSASNSWVQKGAIQPVELDVLPLIRSNTNQSTCDAAVTESGLVCTVYTDQDPTNLSSKVYKYAIANSVTGQNLVAPTALTATAGPKVFVLANQFIIVYSNGSALLFIAINTSTLVAASPVTISSLFTSAGPFDGVVANNRLYLAWDYATTPAVKVAYINDLLAVSAAVSFNTYTATQISVCADETQSVPTIWISWFDAAAHRGYSACVDSNLITLLAVTNYQSATHPAGTPAVSIINLTSTAQNNIVTIYAQRLSVYAYDPAGALRSDYIQKYTITIGGTVGGGNPFLRGVGLASKAFVVDDTAYFLCVYGSLYQPTYFLSDASGNICLKLAYSNGGGYLSALLPNATVSGSTIYIPYLFKDFITSVNKDRLAPASSAFYSQTGINLAKITLGSENLVTAEIGNDLHLSGGFLWMYDGYTPVEHNFHLFPDDMMANGTNNIAGVIGPVITGTMTAQLYNYVATYEWTDNQGNLFRSAPSIPLAFTILTAPANFTANRTSGSASLTSVSSTANLQVGQAISGTGIPADTFIAAISGSTITMTNNATSGAATATTVTPVTLNSVAVNVPTLRLTYKTANPIKIVLYRWSTAQQTFYQVTSVSSPTLNSTSVDYVTFNDILNDSDIIGNNILYTTGGVVENIAAPACSALTLYKGRLFLIDSEDKNRLWFSKQVIQAVPVEMSNLFTMYIAPTVSSQGSTGPMRCLAALDDKLIIFKDNAIYYITGTGPDNTGANNDLSDPIFITSTVGCSNQRSIAFIPQGLMFQSDKGIWLLGRDLSTVYIGAPVESFNENSVTSAVAIPGTNQIRFSLDNGTTLMYDYFYGQWGTFVGIPSISSTLFAGAHTFINAQGKAFQERPGSYLDGSNPVLMSFITSWLNVAGLQGYERAYFLYLLGSYISPHKLTVQIAYDYNPSPLQTTIISPENYNGAYGSNPGSYGDQSPYGGTQSLEQWRVHMQNQTCQAFQISVTETFDSFFGATAGAGLTLSGLNLIVGLKKGYRPIGAANSVG